MPVRSLGHYPHFWPAGSKPDSHNLLFMLIHLLEQLAKLRKTLYLPHYCFIMKEYNSETAGWKRCIGREQGKRPELPCSLSVPLSRTFTHVQQPRRPSHPRLLDFYGGFTTWPWLIESLAIGNWGGETESSNLWSHGWFFWQPASILRCGPSHVINKNPVQVERGLLGITRRIFYPQGSEPISGQETKYNARCSHCSYCLRNCKGSRSCEPGAIDKTKCIYEKHNLTVWITKYIFLLNHNITATH